MIEVTKVRDETAIATARDRDEQVRRLPRKQQRDETAIATARDRDQALKVTSGRYTKTKQLSRQLEIATRRTRSAIPTSPRDETAIATARDRDGVGLG